MRLPSVAVVGGGVIGRGCALELARAGHPVTLVTKDPPERTTSFLAGAVWMPEYARPVDRLVAWGRVSYERLVPLAASSRVTGVQLVPSTLWYSEESPDWTWRSAVSESAVVAGSVGGPVSARWTATAVLPCVDMGRYLPWLRTRGAEAGVAEIGRSIGAVEEAFEFGDVVVLATGLETNALVPGAGMYPIQGQTVRVRNPGAFHHYSWEDESETMYVIPRIDELVIGGTHVVGAWDTTPDPDVEARLLARARELVPGLAGLEVTSRAVGLRPGRDEARLERVGDVIHAYGHGGSGVTVAWGVALEVAALASA